MRLWGSERSTPEQNTGRSDTGYWAVACCMNSPGGVSELTGTQETHDPVRCCLIVKSETDAAKKKKNYCFVQNFHRLFSFYRRY